MDNLTENNVSDNKIHVSILGSCVLRDTIGYYHEGEKFIVDRFVQDVSPLSAVEDSPLLKPLDDFIYKQKVLIDGKEITNFGKRNITLDFEKNAMQYVSESYPEWLLIDVICLRKVILKYEKGIFSVATSGIKPYQSLIDLLFKEGYISAYKEIVSPQNIPNNEFYLALDNFVNKLLEYFSQDKIILFNVRATKYCAMRDGTLSNFSVIENYNAAYKGYDYLVTKLPKAHIIDFPVNTLSDENHKWGRADLHYVREYYDYAYAALEKICEGRYSSSEEEKADLSKLKAQYERIIDEKYKPHFVKTLDGYLQYKTMYENLALSYEKRSDFFYDQFFMENSKGQNFKVEFLRQEYDLLRHIKALYQLKNKYLIILAIKDTAGDCLADEEVSAVKTLGFNKFSKELWHMYIGVLYNGEVICDLTGKNREEAVSFTTNFAICKTDLKTNSMAWRQGNKAEIIINGTDYAVNMRGLNIVVYDMENNKLVDSVAFDYQFPKRICKHN